jgi:putative nucleotidyltransferase with HDIG domain
MNTEYVASGDYKVGSPNEPIKLVALLGTCVGIAIFDKSANVGGLCHILLSEPNDPTDVWQPKNYASTCLPLFVDELLQKGAHRDNLEAIVAGGSLCTPISNRDLIMNIGGRNSETVISFLDRHNIPVIKSETGGCHAMNLSIVPSKSRVEIEHIRSSQSTAIKSKNITKPSPEEIDLAIVNTQPIPQVALKITKLMEEGNYNISSITDELISDQVLSAKLLSFCNSSYFGFKTEIDSIDRAIVILGESYLFESIISTAVNSFFEQEKIGGYALLKGGLFRHSIAVATLAKVISRISKQENEQTAYTAGLLHDIGKVVLDNFISKSQPFFYYSEQEKVSDFIQLEQKFFNADHQSIGALLAKSWNLPASLAEVIKYHHTPEQSKSDNKLIHIVYIADVLASLFMAGVEVEKIKGDYFEKSLLELGLRPDKIPEIIGQVPWNKLMLM